MKEKLAKIDFVKLGKGIGYGCEIVSAIGSVIIGGFQLYEGMGKIKEFKAEQTSKLIDSAAASVENVETV